MTRQSTARSRLVLMGVLLLGGLLIGGGALLAQSEGNTESQETTSGEGTTEETPTSKEASQNLPDEVRKRPEIKPLPKEKTVLGTIESGFESVVEVLGSILFKPIGASTREYVVVQPSAYYVRAAKEEDNDAPFVLTTADGPIEGETLTENELRRLAAAKRVVSAQSGAIFQRGKLDEETIEYAVVKLDVLPENIDYGDTFVRVTDGEGTIYRREGLREVLSDEVTLSPAQIEAYAEQDWLKVDKDDKEKWLLSRPFGGAKLVVVWLAFGSVVFTLYMGFYNLRGFSHAIDVVRGKYDNPEDEGEVTHFQALASALSATVGLGNIGGVAVAMTLGGPGAFFWMLMCGLFGMTSKFVECTLAQKYRSVAADDHVQGGPMRYLRVGLQQLKLGPLGVVLSITFAVMCILASFGGGNMFQANQSGDTIVTTLQAGDRERLVEINKQIDAAAEEDDIQQVRALERERKTLDDNMASFKKNFLIGYGIVLAILVAIVILGGIKRIGKAAEKVVPTMCFLYIAMCLYIIVGNITAVPGLIGDIFTQAFTGAAMGGGFLGVMIVGIQRAAFSNEAGVGSAAIAHSAAKTDEPVREGSVALLGPFIDTIVVCSMTALVILITNAWNNEQWLLVDGLEGASLTTRALEDQSPFHRMFFPWVLSIAVVLFAYSTIISWSYYGERAWEELFGRGSTPLYKLLAVIAVFVGANFSLGAVLDFSDMMILSMAFPNILGALILAPQVKRDLKDYWTRYKAGTFKTYKQHVAENQSTENS